MIKKILPVLFILIGAGAGIGAGYMLKSEPAEMATTDPCGDVYAKDGREKDHGGGHDEHGTKDGHEPEGGSEYVTLNNQFVIPVVSDDMVEALVVVSLGIEVESGGRDVIYQQEPKLRDAMLQVMFDHANIGGFRGRFTDGNNLDVLRMSLREAAQSVIGTSVTGVVITDIARQDV